MGTLVYPVTLTAGSNENVNDLNANLAAIAAVLNGNTDETNVPNLAAAFTTWKTIRAPGGVTGAAAPAATYPLGPNPEAATPALGNAGTAGRAFYLDPADWTANARTTKLRVRAVCIVGSTAPATTLTVGLYPVATWGAAAGASAPQIATVGAVVAGSTVAFASPAANSVTVTLSTEFSAPTAGHYVMGVALTGAASANNATLFTTELQMRQV